MKKKSLSKPVKDFSKLFGANVIVRLIGIVSLYIYARYLSKEELSLLPIYEIIGGMATLFFSFGIFPFLMKNLPGLLKNNITKAKELVLTSILLIVPGALIFSIAVYFFSDFIAGGFFHVPSYSGLIKIMSVGCFFGAISKLNNYLFFSSARFGKSSVLNIIQTSSKTIISLLLFFLYGLNGLITGLVSATILICLLQIIYLRDLFSFNNFTIYPVKEIIRDSLPFYFEGYLMYARTQGDQIILSSMLGAEALAIYYIAKRVYEVFSSLLEQLDNVIVQSLSEVKDNFEAFNNRINRVIKLNTVLLFPAIFLGIGLTPLMITIIAGEGYNESIAPGMILSFGLLIGFSWRSSFGRALFLLHPSASRLKLTAVDAITLVGFLFFFTQWFDVLGVALSRVISNSAAGIYCYIRIKNQLKLDKNKAFIGTVFISSVLMAAIIYSGQNSSINIFLLPVFCLAGILVFIIIINRTFSNIFYDAVNSVIPVKIQDPIKYLSKKILKRTT
jgi:O-antigen/teichoic acid export membrane protein